MAKWGAVLTVDFASGACYDVSAYAGIEFWAKGTDTLVHLAVNNIDWVEEGKGGLCSGECPQGPAKAIDLVRSWALYRVTWQELQGLSGPTAMFDPKRAVTLSFGFYPQDTPFDVWIDDLRFIARP